MKRARNVFLGLLCSLLLMAAPGCVTRSMWDGADAAYVAVPLVQAPTELIRMRDQRITAGDNWYWSEDGTQVYIKRGVVERYTGYSLRSLATPVTLTVDGVVIVVKSMPEVLETTGEVLDGLVPILQAFVQIAQPLAH